MMAIIALADPIETEFSTTIQLYLVRYRDTVPHLRSSTGVLLCLFLFAKLFQLQNLILTSRFHLALASHRCEGKVAVG
jgi:hypothetical protein